MDKHLQVGQHSDGPDVVKHQTAIETRFVQGVPAQGGNLAVLAVNPTPWEEGIRLCKEAIEQFCCEIVIRKTVFTDMPASNYTDWRKWVQELSEQAKQVDWNGYGWEQATLDAILFQCPDPMWKKKIMQGQLNLQDVLEWGIRYAVYTDQGKAIADGNEKAPKGTEPVDRVKVLPP